MREVEFRLEGNALASSEAPVGARRVLNEADRARFGEWVKEYHALSWQRGNEAGLLALGRQIHDWLDGPERWLERLRQVPEAPVVAAFAVPARPGEDARLFLEVPWELAADGGGHLAADASVMWAPLRRVGPRAAPLPPNPSHRLGVMFMAAAPLGQTVLDFEAEESAILRDTARAGLDLVVEDSGNFDELRAAWDDDGSLDALHLSCHGLGGADPFLALEGPGGEREDIGLGKLAGAFVGRPPRLLFLSACHTGENDATVDSLALGLVGVGMPAVLAWADAVNDSDASAFAASFYAEAARRNSPLEAAWAVARYGLLHPDPGRRLPAHWHLARLFLGPRGGGPLAAGLAHRRPAHPDGGRKDIVEARGGRIEVASRFEFVGRRREIQTIRRELRQPHHAGVLIHGLGRQGKSSLAARIMDRNPQLTSVVLFRRCDGPSVLAAIRERVTEAGEICERWGDRVDPHAPNYDPEALYHALRALFDGPCGQIGAAKPILLVLDDFEALLDPPVGTGHWRVKADLVAPLSAILRAFDRGGTDSRLLITCRYEFRLGSAARDPSARLLPVQLADTTPPNRLKQARQKVLALGRAGPTELPESTQQVTDAARGNAGLQDLLFQAVLADPVTGAAAARALEDYLGGGALPEQEDLRDTLEQLLIDKLIEPLISGERQLLGAATLFRLPVPLSVWDKFAASAGLGHPYRLLAFGLWERLPDIADPRIDAAAVNAIAAARLPGLHHADAKRTIAAVLPELFAAWGGADRSRTPYAADIELTRLALACGNLDVLATTAEFAIRGLERGFDYRAAAAIATATLDTWQAAGRIPQTQLLRVAAEIFNLVGDPEGLRRVYANATELGSDDPAQPDAERLARAQFRLRHAGYLARQGQPDPALEELRVALSVFEALGDPSSRAVALGDIAEIMKNKGEIDEALKLHQEELKTYEVLGDRHSRAVTLGQIARILTHKGEVDEALKLHQERLNTYEALGDPRSRAITLGDIAEIMKDKGEVDEALKLHQEELKTYEALGDTVSRAVTLGEIARILTHKGEVDEALKLHQEELKTYEALGNTRSRAATLGDIARIMAQKGEVGEALRLNAELLEAYRQLGDQDGIANASYDIGQMRLALAIEKGNGDAFRGAVEALTESYAINLKIGRLDGIAVVGTVFGRALAMDGERDQAREILRRSLDGFRKLGRAREAALVEEMLRQLGQPDAPA